MMMSVHDRLEMDFGQCGHCGSVHRVFVKICGITTVDDALLAAGLGADAIGLVFAAASPRRVSTRQATEIVDRLPAEVLTVGVFRNELPERVVEIANTVGLRAVQLHGHESPEQTRWVGERVPAMIRAFSVKDPALAANGDYGRHRLLIDSPLPGSGETFDWSQLERVAGDRQYILAGGLHPQNVAMAIEMLSPWGVDVSTGVEAAPGRKDPAKVRRFLAAAREAAGRLEPDGLDRSSARYVQSSADEVIVEPQAAHNAPNQPFDWEEDSLWR